MRKKAILITGASGEIGQALITSLAQTSSLPILTLDLHPVPRDLMELCSHISGDILDHNLLARLVTIPIAASMITSFGRRLMAAEMSGPSAVMRSQLANRGNQNHRM